MGGKEWAAGWPGELRRAAGWLAGADCPLRAGAYAAAQSSCICIRFPAFKESVCRPSLPAEQEGAHLQPIEEVSLYVHYDREWPDHYFMVCNICSTRLHLLYLVPNPAELEEPG